jgi:hypothetical protein
MVVVHGYSNGHVMLINNGAPFSKRVTWERFTKLWTPLGNGLVCQEPPD